MWLSRFAQWNHTPVEEQAYDEAWVAMLQVTPTLLPSQELVPAGCNMVDIGAQGGDTALPLAVAAR